MKDIFTGVGKPLSKKGWKTALDDLGAPEPSLWAILAVETSGFGFLTDRRPKILFERHVFHALTGGRFSAANPDISNGSSGGYQGGAAEYGRLKRAMLLDRRAALESASWGLGQVMGLHAVRLGYANVEAMVEEFKEGEDAQLTGCVTFIRNRKALHDALMEKDWARFAFFYNGKGYARNAYDRKLAAAFDQYSASTPDIEVREAQALLTYLGFNPKGIDGIPGKGFEAALAAFQTVNKLEVKKTLDPATTEALRKTTAVA